LAEVGIAEFKRKVSAELISTKDLPGGICFIASDSGPRHAIACAFGFRLPDTDANVPSRDVL
jgi:hypothetical protein